MGAGAFAFSPIARAAAKPLLKAGFMTDTHIRPGADEINSRTRKAFGLFKDHGVDVIGHCGDLADMHYPESYAFYRSCIETTYPDIASRPKLLYVYANHDVIDPEKVKAGVKGYARQMPYEEGFRDMRRRLGIEHGLFHREIVNGIPFLVFPQSFELDGGIEHVKRMLAETAREFPSRPIVVLGHNAPAKTVFNSENWGYWNYRQSLDAYPQVISISGHTHNSLRNELSIWQGSFTAVDAGCLEWWYGGLGFPEEVKSAYGVLVAEFYEDKVVIRRFDVRDGSEYRPNDPWVVKCPYQPDSACYDISSRRKAEKKPSFPAGAELVFKLYGKNLTLSFPAAVDEDGVLDYSIKSEVKVSGGDWEVLDVDGGVFSQFYIPRRDRTVMRVAVIPVTRFQKELDYRFSVRPVGFFGTEGEALRGTFRLAMDAY